MQLTISEDQFVKETDEEFKKAQKLVQQKLKRIREMNDTLDPDRLQGVFPFCYSHLAIGNSRAGKSYSLFKMLQPESGYKILDRIISGKDIYILSPTALMDNSMGKIINLLYQEYDDFSKDQIFTDIEQGIQAIQSRMKEQLAIKDSDIDKHALNFNTPERVESKQQRSQRIKQEHDERKVKDDEKVIPYLFIIFDDCITEFKQAYFLKFIEKLATMGRHYGINFWLSSQIYKLPPIIRRNATHISIHNMNLQSEIKLVAEELRPSNMSIKEFNHLIHKITKEDYGFLLVCQLKPPDTKYLLNGTDIVLY